MQVIIDLKYKPKKSDLLMYNGSQWILTTKEFLLSELSERIKQLENEIAIIKGE